MSGVIKLVTQVQRPGNIPVDVLIVVAQRSQVFFSVFFIRRFLFFRVFLFLFKIFVA